MIDFLKYQRFYALLSLIIIGIGLVSIIRFGYRVSIDFVGGSTLVYQTTKPLDSAALKTLVEKETNKKISLEKQKENQYLIRTSSLDAAPERDLRQSIENQFKTKVTLLRFETVGPTLGRETLVKTIVASLVATLGILLYLTFAFRSFTYGVAAIGAMFHDILVVVGSYSLLSHFFGAELDTLFVTALLTTMSFSVHDTIVVFDKIREYRKKDRETPFDRVANKALTETMVRSFNNSLTIVLMLAALILLGGEVIRFFIVTLLIGTISGTYSSPFVATPLLGVLEKRFK